MARPTPPRPAMELVSGNLPDTLAASAAMYARTGAKPNHKTDRRQLAKPWQVEAYRHVNICGEARYSVTLFANMAARAEIGISEGNALGRKAVWVNSGPEVDVLAEVAPTVRERKRLVRDFMTHWVIAGECYLIARTRQDNDPEPDSGMPIWEIVAVTELRRQGSDSLGNALWQVRHDNDNYIDLSPTDPVIRMWNPDPENRREAWSPTRSLLPTLREIEWLTMHIFTQVRTRMMNAGVWFLPNNLTFPAPPPEAIEGGLEAMAGLNEAELFMASLAASSMQMLEADEVSYPTVVLADPLALAAVDQDKLITFWSTIDDKAMILRSDAVRRWALGWDLPPEQVLGASGLAVTGTSGSAGSVNHWGVWANEEQTISSHIEPALDVFVDVFTTAVVRIAVPNTDKVVAYDTASLRLRQDRSKEALELNERGLLAGDVTLRENGFDPEHDMMSDAEWKRWLLTRLAGGSATPDQVQESLRLLGVVLELPLQALQAPNSQPALEAPRQPGRNNPPTLEDHPYEGPPREQHDHSPAPFSTLHASAEVLVLRALEKAGNRLLNGDKRGRNRDRSTPAHLAHMNVEVLASAGETITFEFDFDLLPTVMGDLPASKQVRVEAALLRYCRSMYAKREGYSRDGLIEALEGLA